MKTEKPMKVTLGTQETKRGSFLLQFENLQIRELNRKTKTNIANAIKYNTFYYLVDKILPAGRQRLSGIYFINKNEFLFDLLEKPNDLMSIITQAKTYYQGKIIKNEEGLLFVEIKEISIAETLELRKQKVPFDWELNLVDLLGAEA